MAEQNEPKFPVAVNFSLAGVEHSFTNLEEMAKWHELELQTWSSFQQIQDPWNTVIQNNAHLLRGPGGATTAGHILGIGSSYVPATIGPGATITTSILSGSPSAARLAFAFLLLRIKRQSIQWQPANSDHAQAMMASMLAFVVGSPRDTLDTLKATVGQIDQTRAIYSAELDEFKRVAKVTVDTTEKRLKNLATDAALQAPKTYWEGRATTHETSAKSLKRWWHISIAALVVLTLAMGAMLLSSTSNGAPELQLMEGIKHFAVIATVLALSVWWARQLLRDLRSHEHLAEDARERVTMIETYAALKESGLQPPDLAPILSALYRPALTGLVDDSGPVLPFEVALKSIAGKGGESK